MITSIAIQKGGVGKTTTAINLSAGLARAGKKVLLIDVDPQSNASAVLHPNYEEVNKENSVARVIMTDKPFESVLPIVETDIPNLHLSPAHIHLSGADVHLSLGKTSRETKLKLAVDKIKDQYDYIFIDCPPALSWLTINAFTASDEIIVMISPGFFELDAMVQIQETIDTVKQGFNPDIKVRNVLFNLSDATRNTQRSRGLVERTYGDLLAKSIIPRNVDLKDALFKKQDIFEYKPQSAGASAYRKFIRLTYNEHVPKEIN